MWRRRRKNALPAKNTIRRFPHHAISYCPERGSARLDELDYIVFYDKPFLKFERLLETYVALAPRGFRSFQMAIPLWVEREAVSKDSFTPRTEALRDGIRVCMVSFCSPSIT